MENPYLEGLEYGRFVKSERAAGNNPDPRWECAHQAKTLSKADFDEWMRGFNTGVK